MELLFSGFKAAFDAANEVTYVLKLLKDIHEPQSYILHFIDNKAIAIITLHFIHQRYTYIYSFI